MYNSVTNKLINSNSIIIIIKNNFKKTIKDKAKEEEILDKEIFIIIIEGTSIIHQSTAVLRPNGISRF